MTLQGCVQNAGPKEFERGRPFGAMRPACARTPTQSLSSDHDSVNVRPAESSQERPSALLNTRASASLPPPNGDNLAQTSAHSETK